MVGRAGRPQFDVNGTAVIMTQQKNVAMYSDLAAGQEVRINGPVVVGLIGCMLLCFFYFRVLAKSMRLVIEEYKDITPSP